MGRHDAPRHGSEVVIIHAGGVAAAGMLVSPAHPEIMVPAPVTASDDDRAAADALIQDAAKGMVLAGYPDDALSLITDYETRLGVAETPLGLAMTAASRYVSLSATHDEGHDDEQAPAAPENDEEPPEEVSQAPEPAGQDLVASAEEDAGGQDGAAPS